MCTLASCGVRPWWLGNRANWDSERPTTDIMRAIGEAARSRDTLLRNGSSMVLLTGPKVLCAARRFARVLCRAAVFALLVCGFQPQSVAAKSRQHLATGVYLTQDGQVLHALAKRTPGTYWIDGYRMAISNQTQICGHRTALEFGATLTKNGQLVTQTKASVACGDVDPRGLDGGAWLQYAGIGGANGKVAGTRIDVWGQDRAPVSEPRDNGSPVTDRQAPCASGTQHELRYPHEDPISVVCDADVRSYIQHLLESLQRVPSSTESAQAEANEDAKVYVVKPFMVKRNYDFETIDGTRNQIDLAGRQFYENPHARSIVREIVYTADGTVLVPDTVLAHLNNEAQCAASLSYALAIVHQQTIEHLERVQGFQPHIWSLNSATNGTSNLKYMWRFILNLNQKTLRLGINRMYETGYDIREAPFAWAAAQGKPVPKQVLRPNNSFPWFATYAVDYINHYYADVDYSKLKRGEQEYAQFLEELRKADPQAFEPSK